MVGQILYADGTIEVDLERFKLYEPIYRTVNSFALNAQYLNQYFGTEVTKTQTAVIQCVTNNKLKLSQPLQNLLQEWQLQTQLLVTKTEQIPDQDATTLIFPFPTVQGRRRKPSKQEIRCTTELIQEFHYLTLTEEKA